VHARNHNLPDVGRVRSPPKPCVPPLTITTVQRGGVRVLDEPSLVGLMVWVELPSWRPWFGWSIIFNYDGESKGHENQGQKWFQLEAPASKQVGTAGPRSEAGASICIHPLSYPLEVSHILHCMHNNLWRLVRAEVLSYERGESG
jgi:hypothetical protein